MAKFVVSIINYKTPELTTACVESVLVALAKVEGEIVIVDNASEDGSVEIIQDWLSEHPNVPVRLIASLTNTGFSGGHNMTFDAVPDAEFYLILNSDAVIDPGFFEAVSNAVDKDSRVGLYAPRIMTEDGKTQDSFFRFPSVASELIRGANSGPVTRLLSRYVMSLGPEPDETEVRWASFACIVLAGDMVREIGQMDDGYFLYFEDVEYCLRAWRQGWGLLRVPAAKGIHFRGGSGPVKAQQATKGRLPGYYYRSRNRFFAQSVGSLGPILRSGIHRQRSAPPRWCGAQARACPPRCPCGPAQRNRRA